MRLNAHRAAYRMFYLLLERSIRRRLQVDIGEGVRPRPEWPRLGPWIYPCPDNWDVVLRPAIRESMP